ncbi:MAG: glycosyltransferase family 2 protein, partial [Myxococcales bacterium]|nr:glycosyltransferase family 2 protein [Myxococcales bacterium]
MKIGVVIPTLDEAQTVETALRSVVGEGSSDDAVEVIVVDGGSRDETCARARKAGARVIETSSSGTAGPAASRARQLQAGFEACEGDAVLFLHADTVLPEGWAGLVGEALADPGVAGGAFRFRFDPAEGTSAWLRAVEWGARQRVAWLGLPYGDQGIFARRSVLERMGGVPQVAIMEDLDLVDGIKRHGRLARLDAPATTSSRRYRAHGALRTFGR